MKSLFLTIFAVILAIPSFAQKHTESDYLIQTLDSIRLTNWRAESYKYDSLGRNVERLVMMDVALLGIIHPSARYDYSYDQNNRLITDIEYDCDYPFAGWYPKMKTDYHYDLSGKDSVKYFYKWNSTSSSWVYFQKFIFTYSPTEKVLDCFIDGWNIPLQQWLPAARISRFYDLSDQVSTEIQYGWVAASGSWSPFVKRSFTVNNLYDIVTETYEEWGIFPNQWAPLYRITNLYDVHGCMAESILSEFDHSFLTWRFAEKGVYHFDHSFPSERVIKPVSMQQCQFFCDTMEMRNHKLLHSYNMLYTYSNTWIPKGDSTLFFYSDFNTGISKPEMRVELKVFPNPGSGFVNIEGLVPGQNYTARVYGISGSFVSHLPVTNNIIDVTSLGKGVYIIEIGSGDKVAGRSRFIKI